MPAVRSLPISAAHREFTVKVAGQAVPRTHQLLSVSIVSSANRIASARLVYLDGAAAAGDFALSNGELFVPGKQVEISAGDGSSSNVVFSGIVTRHSLRVRDTAAPQLIVECRHEAMKLTVARRNACYFGQSDADVIAALLDNAGMDAEVEPSRVTHQQLVQFHATDWDFLLSRAQASGKLVYSRPGKLLVKAPALSGAPACSLQFGATLIELDAEIDARAQFQAVRGASWDPSKQAMLEVEAAAPEFSGPGNLSGNELAAVAAAERLELRHAAIGEEEALAWAEAAWLRSRVNKVSGRAKCEGIGTLFPGDVVSLGGMGQRFNGNALVTGVRHEFDLVQGWKTHVQFGGVEAHDAIAPDISAAPAGGLLPGVNGLQIGVVVSNEDPDGEHRVRIRLPLVDAGDDGIWARVASPDAGDGRGFFFRPEIGDEVVAGFLDADPRCAVILGMLHSSAKPAPLAGSDDNHEKLYQSRSGMRVYFNDDSKVLRLDTPAGNSLTLSEENQAIVLADQHGNKIAMNAEGITIESAKAFKLKAGSEAGMESGSNFSVKAGTALKLEGTAQAELTSSAATKVAGAMVQIN